MNNIHRIIYHSSLLKNITDRLECVMIAFQGEDIPETLARAIEEARLCDLDEVEILGQPLLGNPIQYDKLTVEFKHKRITIEFYNLELTVAVTQGNLYRGIQRIIQEIKRQQNQRIAASVCFN